jgi:hypothetical protein
MPRCSATTAAGQQCANSGAYNGLCGVHAGAPVGAPSKLLALDHDAVERLLTVLRVGGYPEVAASVAGVHVRTYERWLARGRAAGSDPEDEPYRAFAQRVDDARAHAEMRAVGLIAQAAQSQWQAAAWLLERQFPERWARVSQRDKAEPEPPTADPFAEVDQLAEARRRRGA